MWRGPTRSAGGGDETVFIPGPPRRCASSESGDKQPPELSGGVDEEANGRGEGADGVQGMPEDEAKGGKEEEEGCASVRR